MASNSGWRRSPMTLLCEHLAGLGCDPVFDATDRHAPGLPGAEWSCGSGRAAYGSSAAPEPLAGVSGREIAS
jgi:hypothetical protein